MALVTTDQKVRFIEATSTSAVTGTSLSAEALGSINTPDIVFVPTLNAIYHNGKYYGFTDEERNIIDKNNGYLIGEIRDRIKDITVNSSSSNDAISITGIGTSTQRNVQLTLTGTTLPIDTTSSSTIKQYIDATVAAAQTAAQTASKVTITINSNNTQIASENGTDISFDISGSNIRVGSTISGNAVATSINAGSTVAGALENLDKEILKASTRINDNSTSIASNAGSITAIKNSKWEINTGNTTGTTATSWIVNNTTSGTIYINSNNIVVGGGSIAIDGGGTIGIGSTIHAALEALRDRLNNISSVSGTTLEALHKLEYELNNPGTDAGISSTFLDKISTLLSGFNINTANVATTGTDNTLKNAIATMISSSITDDVDNFKTIKFVSSTNANAGSSFSQGITTDSLNSTGTVNIIANDLVIGSTIATANTVAIASSDTISIALGKLQKNIANVSSSAGDIDSFNKIVINSTTLSNPTTIQQTDTHNQTATFNIRATELILGASSNDGVVTLATTDTIIEALNKLNSNTQNKLNSKLEKITINGQTHNTPATSASILITAQDATVGVNITNGAVEINASSTIATALQQLDVALGTTNTNLQTATTNLFNATTNLFNATTAINNQLVWYTL